jgi:glutamate-1-semialdehyde 2,1-aminomutase
MNNNVTNSGALLWNKAKKIIPGGNQLLSKRAEMFLPDFWPAYYKKAKGCEIWDLDDNHYYDMSIMGIGTCVLGYANDDINASVTNVIANGSMTSLNCYEEVELAEKLIELHPWSSAARFARTGGESCAIAIRIARSHTNRDKVAFCGYHGWHDWYLATNLNSENNLDEQLLPGLAPSGVPKSLSGSALPFNEGDLDGFKEILKQNGEQCAAVVMEVFRHALPDLCFLRAVRKLCDEHNIVLIFDEISSGFRLNIGGSHLLWDIQPDICVLGKALGNGHPIGAVIGRKHIMDAAQSSFISSSYWTERVGFMAGLKTIELYHKENVIERITSAGQNLRRKIVEAAAQTCLKVDVIGIDSVLILTFDYEYPLVVKTLFTQEMLKRGFLASNVIYVSIAHTSEVINLYIEAVNEVFSFISTACSTATLEQKLDGPVCHSGFSRLN